MNRASQMTHELNEVYSLWSRERLRVSRAGERGRENDVGVFVRPFQFFDGRKLVHNKCVGTAGARLSLAAFLSRRARCRWGGDDARSVWAWLAPVGSKSRGWAGSILQVWTSANPFFLMGGGSYIQ